MGDAGLASLEIDEFDPRAALADGERAEQLWTLKRACQAERESALRSFARHWAAVEERYTLPAAVPFPLPGTDADRVREKKG